MRLKHTERTGTEGSVFINTVVLRPVGLVAVVTRERGDEEKRDVNGGRDEEERLTKRDQPL